MRRARIASLRPSIRLNMRVIGGIATVDVENLGVGPATGIDATLVVETDEEELESHPWTRALMRTGERQTMLVPRGQGRLMKLSELEALAVRVRISGTCADLDGREHVIADVLSFAVLGDRSPEGSWVGVEDRVPENIEKVAKELEAIHRILKDRQRGD
jgi:hypothetical protein